MSRHKQDLIAADDGGPVGELRALVAELREELANALNRAECAEARVRELECEIMELGDLWSAEQ